MPKRALPRVSINQSGNGGLSISLHFHAAQPTASIDWDRYELAEFIGELDVPADINGQTIYPSVICKIFFKVPANQRKAARWNHALEQAQSNSPVMQ